jgi:hypothetical protein
MEFLLILPPVTCFLTNGVRETGLLKNKEAFLDYAIAESSKTLGRLFPFGRFYVMMVVKVSGGY